MRRGFAGLAGLIVLAGCGGDVPEFLGREGTGQSTFELGGEEPVLSVPVPLAEARLEPAATGTIVVAQGVAPTQGFHTAGLAPVDDGRPDAAGIITFRFMALPPTGPEAVGPPRTRGLQAAAYIPTRAERTIRGVRVTGVDTSRTLTLR
jgi:hypothetical protein